MSTRTVEDKDRETTAGNRIETELQEALAQGVTFVSQETGSQVDIGLSTASGSVQIASRLSRWQTTV